MFDTDSKTVWEKDVRELAIDIKNTCKNDFNLVKALEVMIMHIDSDSSKDINFHERLLPLHGVITSESYYKNNRSLTNEEVAKIKSLINPLTDLFKITANELRYQKPKVEVVTPPERLPNHEFSMDMYNPVKLRERLN